MSNKIFFKIKKFFYFGNRTYEDYIRFLESARKHHYKLVPLRELVDKVNPDEQIIGLRHDIDVSLDLAIKIATIEHRLNIRSTYFVLHTAKYFYKDIPNNKINKRLIRNLLYLQNTLGHEIGLHSDLVTTEYCYQLEPQSYLNKILAFLKSEGINISGIAPHGSLLKSYGRKQYVIMSQEVKNQIYLDPFIEFDPKTFNLLYEAYSIDHDIYFSDAKFIDQKRWDLSAVNFGELQTKKRIIISIHPIQWSESKLQYYTKNLFLTIRYTFEYFNHFYHYWRAK